MKKSKVMKVLFVCRGNASRSQMAEAIFNHLARGKFEALSAGLKPADRVSSKAKAVLKEIGIEWDGRPKALTREMIENADIVVAMCKGDFPMEKTIYWDVEDPMGKDLEFYRAVRDEIYRRVKELLNSLKVG